MKIKDVLDINGFKIRGYRRHGLEYQRSNGYFRRSMGRFFIKKDVSQKDRSRKMYVSFRYISMLFFIVIDIHTLSLKSLSGHSSVCYKTGLNTGGVGQAGAAPPTSKLEKFLSWPLALSVLIYSNFQINGTSGETLKPPDP